MEARESDIYINFFSLFFGTYHFLLVLRKEEEAPSVLFREKRTEGRKEKINSKKIAILVRTNVLTQILLSLFNTNTQIKD